MHTRNDKSQLAYRESNSLGFQLSKLNENSQHTTSQRPNNSAIATDFGSLCNGFTRVLIARLINWFDLLSLFYWLHTVFNKASETTANLALVCVSVLLSNWSPRCFSFMSKHMCCVCMLRGLHLR
jgi:hypothetical protein